MNGWSLFVLMGISTFLYADEKIFQMVYAKNQPAFFNKNKKEQQNRNLLYCIKTDNNFYIANVIDTNKSEYQGKHIQLLAPKHQNKNNFDAIINNKDDELKNYDLELLEGRLMLIGQPIVYNDQWIMPAVIKRKYFDFLQSTDLCIIVQRKVNTKIEDEKYISNYDSIEYIAYKIADGHRVLANFVGIIKTSNQHTNDLYEKVLTKEKNKDSLLLFSSSIWPTLKITNLHAATKFDKHENFYTCDSFQQENDFFYVNAYIKRLYFGKKELMRLAFYNQKESTKKTFYVEIDRIQPHFLPKISLNPEFIFNESIENIQNTLVSIFSDKRLQDKNTRYKVYVFGNNQAIFVPTHKTHENIASLWSKVMFSNNLSHKDKLITASVCDYQKNRLFLAKYDEESKKSFIQDLKIGQDIKIEIERNVQIEEETEGLEKLVL